MVTLLHVNFNINLVVTTSSTYLSRSRSSSRGVTRINTIFPTTSESDFYFRALFCRRLLLLVAVGRREDTEGNGNASVKVQVGCGMRSKNERWQIEIEEVETDLSNRIRGGRKRRRTWF